MVFIWNKLPRALGALYWGCLVFEAPELLQFTSPSRIVRNKYDGWLDKEREILDSLNFHELRRLQFLTTRLLD